MIGERIHVDAYLPPGAVWAMALQNQLRGSLKPADPSAGATQRISVNAV
jgi:hypothetical protein